MKNLSAGTLIKSNGLYLICHATQIKKDEDPNLNWTIPKGRVESHETVLDAAIRELKEETNVDLLKFNNVFLHNSPFNTYKTSYREVRVFLIEDVLGLLQKCELKCNSLITDNENSAYYGLYEMDGFMWATREQAYNMVFNSQKHLFEMKGN